MNLDYKELEGQVKKTSANSSKPPSSDGFNKPNPKSLRKRSKRSQGGQPGHTGQTLRQSVNPDEIIQYIPDYCLHCTHELESQSCLSFEKRQVFDLPKLALLITEHQFGKVCCPCCQTLNYGKMPTEIIGSVQYGRRIKELMVYLSHYQLLPYNRLREFFIDVFEQHISQGTLAKANELAYSKLESVESRIVDKLSSSSLLHADETGIRVDKMPHWLHVACNKRYTHYSAHKKRGSEAIDEAGILPHFKGALVHDHFKPYFHYGNVHALCNAHHLRELTYIQEQFGCKWARKIEQFLLLTKKKVEIHFANTGEPLTELEYHKLRRKLLRIISSGRKETPHEPDPKGKRLYTKQSKARCLLERLRKHLLQVIAFIADPYIPFHNNLAERDIRMTKVKLKISGCFCALKGAQHFCRIRGFISTVRKNQVKVLDALNKVFVRNQADLLMDKIIAAE